MLIKQVNTVIDNQNYHTTIVEGGLVGTVETLYDQ